MSLSKLAVLLSIAAVVAAIPAPAEDLGAPIPGYGIFIPQWKVEVSPGHFEILNGTVQEVVAQATEIAPTFEKTFEDDMAIAVTSAAASMSERALTKRGVPNCKPRPGEWHDAKAFRVREGVDYLRGLGGTPYMQPGPGYCSRVSCSWEAAIWMCNDKNYARYVSSWWGVADSAAHTVNECEYQSGLLKLVRGQNFEVGDWNTIVRKDNC